MNYWDQALGAALKQLADSLKQIERLARAKAELAEEDLRQRGLRR